MSILKIARLGHPVLNKKAIIVKNLPDPKIKKLIEDMIETMLDANGIGLAAPQVHVNKQVIIFRIPKEEKDEKDEKDELIEITALINPKLSNISDETEDDWEGCLSIPGMSGLVKRFSKVRYEGFDMTGNVIKKTAEGFHARVIQHEFDHLMGILYIHKLADSRAFGFSEEIENFWKNRDEKN
jgi:peptide deformylase